MPLAEMFVSSILEFWGLSEDIPWRFVPGTQERYDWCFAQAFKRSKDLTAILETGLGAEPTGKGKRPAPSITSPPTQRKRKTKTKNCPFDIQERRAEMGAESVQIICPDDELPDLEHKIVSLVDTVARNHSVTSLEFQVCSRRPLCRKPATTDIFRFCQSVPIGVFHDAIDAVVRLIGSMRDGGRQMRFIGLANTLLDDQHARRISGALRSLVDLSPGHEPETLELHRMVFQAATRRELLTEARRADVNLLLSDPNGPALRGF
jgi:hypothetical protein